MQSGRVWKLQITGKKQYQLIPVSITANVENIKVYIDGENKGSERIHQLTEGKHEIRVEKEGYKSKTKTIDVNRDNADFDFNLVEIEPVLFTIKSIPKDAAIFINGVEAGKTDKSIFRFPGRYSIKLTKPGFSDYKGELTISDTGENEFLYTLEKNSVTLTLNITPKDSKLLIDNEDYTKHVSIELAPGIHKIEISKPVYKELSEAISLEKGKPITKNYILEAITGKLQFTIQPLEAECKLLQNGEEKESWIGAKYFSKLLIGEYILECSYPDHEKLVKTINIKEGETIIEDVSLEQRVAQLITKSGKDRVNKSGLLDMVHVKGGTFSMGSNNGKQDEQPVHQVLLNGFYISKYEITQNDYSKILGENPSEQKGRFLPVTNVSWYDAVIFCNKLSETEGLEKIYKIYNPNPTYIDVYVNWNANGYRLPTEAEWEYAARGGNSSKGYAYSGSDDPFLVAWFETNSPGHGQEVGEKQPNELGIYDMSGNVFEWCHDWYGKNIYKAYSLFLVERNPKGPGIARQKVKRGGSFQNSRKDCRSSSRYSNSPKTKNSSTGFRVVRSTK